MNNNPFKIYNSYMRFHSFNPITLGSEENKSLEVASAVKSVSSTAAAWNVSISRHVTPDPKWPRRCFDE